MENISPYGTIVVAAAFMGLEPIEGYLNKQHNEIHPQWAHA